MPTAVLKSPPAGMPTSIVLTDRTRVGGEGTVHFSTDGKYAIKVYHGTPVEREKLLGYVMTIFRTIPRDQERYILPPLALVQSLNGKPCVGFVMRRVEDRYRELVDFVLHPAAAAAQFKQGRTWADYLKLARSISSALVVLHGKGCAHSDIHFSNFLADLRDGSAVMLEVDGVVVPGFLPAQVAGMAGFMAPEIVHRKARPDERTDRHSLAVLVLHTLLFRNAMQPLIDYATDPETSEQLGWGEMALFSEHPADRRHRPKALGVPLFSRGCLSYTMLTEELRRLTDQAFMAGLRVPDDRPTSRDWERALACAIDELWPCTRCRQWFPYPHWLVPAERRTCPFCGMRISPPAPVVLRLLEERGKTGFYTTHRRVVLGSGFRLYADVVDPSRVPPPSRQQEGHVAHVEWDRVRCTWRLVNDNAGVITSSVDGARQEARRGSSIVVEQGAQIHFGPGARMALVVQAGA